MKTAYAVYIARLKAKKNIQKAFIKVFRSVVNARKKEKQAILAAKDAAQNASIVVQLIESL